jgi:outer membrane protein OmpA-like peptidoglycan-associated protein
MMRKLPLILITAGLVTVGCKSEEQAETESEPSETVLKPVEEVAQSDVDLGAAEGKPSTVTAVYVDATLAVACDVPAAEVFFEFDGVKLTDDARARMTKIADCVTSDRLKGQQLAVIGHASPVGSDAYNQQLGMSRAESVERFLIEQGVTADRLSVDSMGEDRAPDALDDQRWPYGRRVELRIADGTETGTP